MNVMGRVLQLTLILVSSALAFLAFKLSFIRRPFEIPVAFTCIDEKLFVAEKDGNKMLELEWTEDGRSLRLCKRYAIEQDDKENYYIVLQIYPAKDGMVVLSGIYSHSSQDLIGYRFRKFKSFSDEAQDILSFFYKDSDNDIDVSYCADEMGNSYFINQCAGRRNLWKVLAGTRPLSASAGEALPTGIIEMGEINTRMSNWSDLTLGPDGKIFAPSGETAKIFEYSQSGEKIREFGDVGFGRNQLLAPSSIFFIRLPGNETPLLTVANNRSWLQFDSGGNVVNSISPLEMGYPYPDILAGRIYQGGPGRHYSFDLANRAALQIGDKIRAVSEYSETRPLLFLMILALSLAVLMASFQHARISRGFLNIRVPFFMKLAMLLIPMLAASLYITGLWVKAIVKRSLDAESLRRSANISHAILSSISIEDLEKIQKPEDRMSPEYDRVYASVSRISENSGVDQMPKWALYKVLDGRYYFGINSWKGPIFEPFIISDEKIIFSKALDEKKPQSGTYTDSSGEWFSYLRPVADKNGKIIYMLELYRDTEGLNRTNREISSRVLGAIGGTGLAVGTVLLAFSYFFMRPLRSLVKGTKLLGEGNFENRIPVISRDEIGDLAISFNQMVESLKKYIADLASTTSQKEKMESELRIAHDIQMSIIPNTFPAFPDRPEFDIHASLTPAKAVGGDLYDFFFMSDNHLCFAIGDVSGKGVPASLLMAVTRTLLRAKGFACMDISKITTEMNIDLVSENRLGMFVTFFLAVIDIRSGEIRYTNAGHNPPFIIRKDGRIEKLENIHGMPLGIMNMEPYEEDKATLSPGDSIVLYTDGVTEAMNADEIQYDEERFKESLSKISGKKAAEGINTLHQDVNAFVNGADQSDDITILVLNYHGHALLDGAKNSPL